MNKVKVSFTASRIATKELKTKDGNPFTLYGIEVGDKFIRCVYPKGHKLNPSGVMGELYPRKYKGKNGSEYTEVAIYVTNSVPIDDVTKDNLPF